MGDAVSFIKLEQKNKRYDYEVCGVKLKSGQCAKDLGVKIVSNHKSSQQSEDVTNKTNRIWSFIKGNFSFKNKDVILPLYNSLVRPHLEYAVQF